MDKQLMCDVADFIDDSASLKEGLIAVSTANDGLNVFYKTKQQAKTVQEEVLHNFECYAVILESFFGNVSVFIY